MKTVMQVPNIDGEPLLKTKQLAQATGFHPLDLEDAARDGVVPSLRLGDTWYFLLSAFTEAVAAQVRAGSKPRLQDVAADIKNLRAERDEEAAAAAAEIERLREELTASHESHGNEVGALTERLSLAIHERDEARREVCELLYNRQGGWPKEHATERGWDCFKENTDD